MGMKRRKDEEYYKINDNGCWEFLLAKDKDGYGLISIGKKQEMAHRYFYKKYKGKIKKGMVIDHLCRNTCCVNPDHLEVVTPYENYIRGNNAKLSKENVIAIRNYYELEDNPTMTELADIFDISIAQISRIINYKTWKNI
jgi:hypothetical protein